MKNADKSAQIKPELSLAVRDFDAFSAIDLATRRRRRAYTAVVRRVERKQCFRGTGLYRNKKTTPPVATFERVQFAHSHYLSRRNFCARNFLRPIV
jgi:hypothetical protein